MTEAQTAPKMYGKEDTESGEEENAPAMSLGR